VSAAVASHNAIVQDAIKQENPYSSNEESKWPYLFI
jgi:hypothetical protein